MEIIEHKFRSTTYRLYVQPGERVEIHTYTNDNLTNVRVFVVGDVAEYDSYNLSYTGRIEKITKKNAIFNMGHKRKMLKWTEFAWRNWDFNEAVIRERNNEMMLYI